MYDLHLQACTTLYTLLTTIIDRLIGRSLYGGIALSLLDRGSDEQPAREGVHIFAGACWLARRRWWYILLSRPSKLLPVQECVLFSWPNLMRVDAASEHSSSVERRELPPLSATFA